MNARLQQLKATDPLQSAWVAANAGSGKTHVLVNRIARLLLSGSAPDRLLCLTFTKAAAAEMSSRLFGQLGAWTLLPDEKLRAALTELCGEEVQDALVTRARKLFAEALDPFALKHRPGRAQDRPKPPYRHPHLVQLLGVRTEPHAGIVDEH